MTLYQTKTEQGYYIYYKQTERNLSGNEVVVDLIEYAPESFHKKLLNSSLDDIAYTSLHLLNEEYQLNDIVYDFKTNTTLIQESLNKWVKIPLRVFKQFDEDHAIYDNGKDVYIWSEKKWVKVKQIPEGYDE